MTYLMGLDIGTSAVKGVLVSVTGDVMQTANAVFVYRQEGTARLLEPREFLNSCYHVINTLAAALPMGGELKALSSCCASGSLVLLDAENHPLTPIIGWQSTVDEAEFATYYNEEQRTAIYQTVGWPAINSFPVAHLPWLARHKPDLLQRADKVCMAAEYLNLTLCGGWGISTSMGTPFYLLDQARGIYNRPFLESLGLREEQLPPIFPKGTVVGAVTATSPVQLPCGTRVVLGGFDHPSAATGAGVYEPGEMLLSCGTSWVECFPVNHREQAIATALLVDRFMTTGVPYCVMSSLTSVSENITAYRRHYLGDISHREYDVLVAAATPDCHGLRLDLSDQTYPSLEGYTREDIARGILEAAARLLKQNLDEAEKKGLYAHRITLVGGVANAPICVQVIADTLGRELTVVNGESAGAIGAAMLAGVGCGVFADERDAFTQMRWEETALRFSPRVKEER